MNMYNMRTNSWKKEYQASPLKGFAWILLILIVLYIILYFSIKNITYVINEKRSYKIDTSANTLDIGKVYFSEKYITDLKNLIPIVQAQLHSLSKNMLTLTPRLDPTAHVYSVNINSNEVIDLELNINITIEKGSINVQLITTANSVPVSGVISKIIYGSNTMFTSPSNGSGESDITINYVSNINSFTVYETVDDQNLVKNESWVI